jgi:hypothetical protein
MQKIELFKLSESPFYSKRKKIESGAEVNIQCKFNQGRTLVRITSPAWINPKSTFNFIHLN